MRPQGNQVHGAKTQGVGVSQWYRAIFIWLSTASKTHNAVPAAILTWDRVIDVSARLYLAAPPTAAVRNPGSLSRLSTRHVLLTTVSCAP